MIAIQGRIGEYWGKPCCFIVAVKDAVVSGYDLAADTLTGGFLVRQR